MVAPALKAAIIYEFRMAVRRRVLWLALLPLLGLAVLIGPASGRGSLGPTSGAVAGWVVIMNVFAVVGLGVVLADRFVRTHRLALTELLASTPASITTRMAGALIGSLAAGLVPVTVTMLVAAPISLKERGWAALASLLWVVVAVATVIVPAAVVTTVLAATLALVVPVPVARVLVVCAWFWATTLNVNVVPVPTPTGTVLSPLGDYVAAGWLGGEIIWAGRGTPDVLSPPVTAGSAGLNLAVVLLVAACLFAVATVLARRRL